MKQVNGWWISGHPGSPDPIAEQSYDVGVIDLALKYVGRRRTALQAGARAGLWPWKLAPLFDRVISFEPEPDNFACTKRNLEAFYNVELYQKALGATNGKGLLQISGKNDGTHYMASTTKPVHGAVLVDVVTIDSLELSECSIIFLDVEGTELSALKGAIVTLATCRPVLVLEENVLCHRYNHKQGDLEKWLELKGYTVVERYGKVQPTRHAPFPGADLILIPT